MRQIKFRGKRIKNGTWVFGHYAEFVVEEGEQTKYAIIDWKGNWSYVDPSTVGQFTGLTDKNGKEIYEGDIVITSQGEKDVFYDSTIGGFCFTMKVQGGAIGEISVMSGDPEMSFPIFNAGDKEIIGNIHDKK